MEQKDKLQELKDEDLEGVAGGTRRRGLLTPPVYEEPAKPEPKTPFTMPDLDPDFDMSDLHW